MERCDNCHKMTDNLFTYQWYAGKKGGTKQYEPKRELTGSGYRTTTFSQTSYNNITPIITGLCPNCFRKALNTKRIIASLLILVLVVTSAIVSHGNTTVQILLLLILIPVFIGQLKHFKKGEAKFHKEIFTLHARLKMTIGQDTLWTPEEYSRLR